MQTLNQSLKKIFSAESIACSLVTDREATGDKAVTVTKSEKEVLAERYDLNIFIRKGGAAPNNMPNEHYFNVFDVESGTHRREALAVTYPKATGNELRLYFREDAGFSPYAGTIWFIFTRKNVDEPFIGYVSNDELESLITDYQLAQQYDKICSIDTDDDSYQKAIYFTGAKPGKYQVTITRQDRNANLAASILKSSGYKCQMDVTHESFTSASTGNGYVEAHHLVPISKADDFEYSLDVEENIIPLCPNCHRAIHYGTSEVKKQMLDTLYEERSDGLQKCGINLSKALLYSYYVIDS